MEWMILPYKRYADFSGRSRRKEYWMFILFTILVNFGLTLVQGALGLSLGVDGNGAGALAVIAGVGLLSLLFALGTLIPSIAVLVRRLHDTDRSGWWLLAPVGLYLIGFAVAAGGLATGAAAGSANAFGAGVGLAFLFMGAGFIMGLVIFVFLFLDGTRGPNRFGPDPKDPAGATDLNEVFR